MFVYMYSESLFCGLMLHRQSIRINLHAIIFNPIRMMETIHQTYISLSETFCNLPCEKQATDYVHCRRHAPTRRRIDQLA